MEKWDVLRIHCDFLPRPHDKFSICICPARNWFFWIDSEPPMFRRAKLVAVSVQREWAQFLTHDSYVDTTQVRILPNELVQDAWDAVDGDGYHHRRHGKIINMLKIAILDGVESHNALTDEFLAAIRE